MNFYCCFSCGYRNDAMSAPWCSCVTSDRTLICQSCGRCFCGAPTEVTRGFWQDASAELRFRRRQEQSFESRITDGMSGDASRPFILVVDDDKTAHVMADRVLSEFQGTVFHANDGQEGLAMARALKPDLVITDALLPKLDGREIALAMKSDPTTSSCKVIVMTGLYKGMHNRTEEIRTYLADDFLEDPVSPRSLLSVVAHLVATLAPSASGGGARPQHRSH